MKLMFTLLWVAFLGLGQGQAALRFVELSQSITADPDDRFVTLDYQFTNEGAEVVSIEKIQSGCSCLSGETDKADYQAGETGKIRLKFKTGILKGTVSKSVTVVTSDRQQQKLEAIVTVPELVTVVPRTLKWRTTDSNRAQVFEIKMTGKTPINVTGLKASTEDFELELTTVKAGREYRVTATPKNTSKPNMCLVTIQTDSEVRRFQTNQAFLVINQAPPNQR